MTIRALVKKIENRLKELFKIRMLWRPHYAWLYKNRFLRMDANIALHDQKRRLFHSDRYEFAVRCLKEAYQGKDITILDAACGTGYGSNILKQVTHKQIVGVDICPETINYANKKYSDEQCSFDVADVIDFKGIKKTMFDAVVSFETIEHLEDPILFLDNIDKYLNPEGKLIISTPNKWGLTKDHKFDYDYFLFREHLEKFFDIEDIYTQNSGSMDLWVNRGVPRRLVKTDSENIDQAECFIAVCKKKE